MSWWSERQLGRGGRRWRRGRGQRLRRPRAASGRLRRCLGGGGGIARRGQRLVCGLGIGAGREVAGSGLGGGVERRRLGGGGGGVSSAAAAMHTRANRREDRMNRRGCGPSVKFAYVRWPVCQPSDISLCLTPRLQALGCPALCLTAASSRRT
jgi:hypothetical protein